MGQFLPKPESTKLKAVSAAFFPAPSPQQTFLDYYLLLIKKDYGY